MSEGEKPKEPEEVTIECGRCDYKGKAKYSPAWCGITCPKCEEEGRRPLVFPTDMIGEATAKPKEGWSYINQSPKWHYFISCHSLCGRWLGLGLGELEQGKDDSPDNCMACRRKLEKLIKRRQIKNAK